MAGGLYVGSFYQYDRINAYPYGEIQFWIQNQLSIPFDSQNVVVA